MITATAIGRLTSKPEVKAAGDQKVTNFSIASDNRDGSTTTFVDIQAWGRLGETVAEHAIKGQLVAVTGRFESRQYETDGQKRVAWRLTADQVQFLTKPRTAGSGSDTAASNEGEEPF